MSTEQPCQMHRSSRRTFDFLQWHLRQEPPPATGRMHVSAAQAMRRAEVPRTAAARVRHAVRAAEVGRLRRRHAARARRAVQAGAPAAALPGRGERARLRRARCNAAAGRAGGARAGTRAAWPRRFEGEAPAADGGSGRGALRALRQRAPKALCRRCRRSGARLPCRKGLPRGVRIFARASLRAEPGARFRHCTTSRHVQAVAASAHAAHAPRGGARRRWLECEGCPC